MVTSMKGPWIDERALDNGEWLQNCPYQRTPLKVTYAMNARLIAGVDLTRKFP
jgi:hypothetical protein